MRITLLRETVPGERRVALTPDAVARLAKAGYDVHVQTGAGSAAGYTDTAYSEAGASMDDSREALLRAGGIICQIHAFPAAPDHLRSDLGSLSKSAIIIGLAEPLTAREPIEELAETRAISFALELLPRITRAQSMDVLSSQASIAGYKAVLVAANHLPRMFPMMMTAAGTITPARVFVIGAGVAGLQAIATAKRLGGVVKAYDVRAAVREEVESLGAAFIEMDTTAAQDDDQNDHEKDHHADGKGGYAQQMDEDFYARQRDFMARIAAESDVIITTAAIPGRDAPLLITEDAVRTMPAGSVIVDLAAARGGNCESSRPDDTVTVDGVTVLGPTNLPSEVAYHASQTFARNIVAFIENLIDDETGTPRLDSDDEIIRETSLTRDGTIINPRVREHFNLSPLNTETSERHHATEAPAQSTERASESETPQEHNP